MSNIRKIFCFDFSKYIICLVSEPCEVRSDCIVLGGRSVCKEGKEGEKTCLKDLDKKCSCMADQFCSANNTCVTQKPEGTPGKKKIFL